jgi:sodium--glutamate symport carrier gltS
MSITFGVLVLLVGKKIKDNVAWLHHLSIPNAVVGGVFRLIKRKGKIKKK